MSTPSLDIRRRELAFREERGGFSLTLKRNCSISPAALACAGLEVLLLGAAYVPYARHAVELQKRLRI